MAKKRITRKKVNDPIVDTALRDIYDKLEELQPEINQTITSRAPTVGMMTTVTTDANVTSMATYTQDGWLVDVNSNFQPVNSTRGFNAIKGIKGVDKKPIKNEAVVYDEKSRIPVTTLKFDDMAISQTPQAYDEKGQMKFINDAFTINTTALALNAALNYSSGTAQSLQLISNGADSSVIFRDGATPKYSIGYDQSDAGKFKIGAGSTLHTSTKFTLDTDGNITSEGTIKIKEVSAAIADTAGYGQLWVKDEDPAQLYYTNDDGEDIQITHNDHLAPTEQIRLQVRNDEGSTIPAGAPLYSKGEIGGSERILVGIADSSDANKMPCIGIAYEEMNTSSTQDNFAVLNGVYNTNITITSVAEQNTIYVAPHGGSSPYLTITRPTSSSHLVQNIGICIRQTATNTCAGMYVSSIGRTNDIPNDVTLNDLSDVSYSSGDLTITGLDTIISGALTIDSSADIELNADGGNITFKDNTTELFKIQSGGVRFQDMDGIFFNVDDLDKIYGDGDDIVIAKDDTDVIFVKDTEVTTALPLKIKESAAAVSDTAAYGQIWIKNNTPNELAFTDDAGTDIIGVGKYMYDIQRVGYYSTVSTVSYLPLNGYIIEGTSSAGRNEYQAFVAPYNGTLEKIMWRSEALQNGSFRNLIWESADGTEVPGTISGRWDPSVNVADDTTVTFDFTTGATSGDNVLTKGNIYAISIDPVAIPYDTNATVVFKWDITS